MAKTGFLYHADYLQHQTGPGHPERPERLQNLMAFLRKEDYLSQFTSISPESAERKWIEKNHTNSYIDYVKNACKEGQTFLDSDTVISLQSYRVALLAVGGALQACAGVMTGELDNAFCAIRPPGHHAERARAMGFCLFNNVAIAAKYLQSQHLVEKVCIIDWDVHHGNGTQHAFYEDPSVLYISIHQHPLFPGSGREDERGEGPGEGTTLNFPSPPGFGDMEYIGIFEKQIARAVRDFAPDFMLVSAGFDAHRDDPLANMRVTEEGFSEMTRIVKSLAEECCGGRLVALLEGGYNLEALARSVAAHLSILKS